MNADNINETTKTNRPGRLWLELGLAAAAIALFAVMALRMANAPVAGRMITLTELESRYGLRVNLVALTAAGGMLDVRLKIVDAQKAALLLGSPDHFPVVAVDGSPVRLNAPPEARTQAAHLVDGGGMLVIFPNAGNTVRTDTKVRLVFGDVQIESISVR